MAVKRGLLIIIFLLGAIAKLAPKKNCRELRIDFSNVSKTFLDCVIENSEPVTYCRKCVDSFSDVVIKYNLLVGNETCKSRYFDRDRLNILATVYSNAVVLWEAGSCSNCYDWVDPTNKHINQNESEATTQFFHNYASYDICVDKYKESSDICLNCANDYNSMNDLYKEIKKKTSDKFCFDIKDVMNKTQLNWSHDLKCCKDRKSSLTAFIVTSSIIAVLIPVVFYTSFMFFGWRRQQLDYVTMDSVEPCSSTQLPIQSSTVPAIAPLLDLDQ
ncbi:Osteopetrosis-associated transmembrane protein 1 [Pseudolycoriella hygida]|uniref:Osteopetrosis-associated transmembrane protein 1 n=1 Tax=Pseudolycoriella hygida TaxID=35572 RepID=A0A9Q0NAF4_9DIPT|nr:Osteopetrosis-associated transmembrane protein 1 [Pseudolycoriella hygida]